ncbi:MAG: prepilin-type N-terminal cleavage/methylation domain-containing protein [Patescibacteria group bacterium]
MVYKSSNNLINHKFKKEAAGFTLVEILVVMSIIVTLSVIVLPSYRDGDRQFALQRSANKLAQDIRRIEEMAISSVETGGEVPLGGYGVYFDISNPNQYILFADFDGDHVYDEYGGEPIGNPVNFEANVKIDSLLPTSPLNITFTSPDPTISINNDPAIIISTITIGNGSDSENIIVNKAGLIYVE